ncbi:M14 family metallopeptidase [Thalassospira sp. TSL5-1]|uniref:M14 family metallopeptidase n=1 Tax=Thalassospira sp. TSL5-1 TaxID=1544451 RepID=UPI00093F61E0|nr:M14 family metallopeptidase [Thalassospira sp. TSL5-1]OKH90221.1 peptidase M14 [Thalassospira sp. TSL5-1]
MSEIFKQSFPRSLDQLIEHYNNDAHRGTTIEAWLFEDEATRRAGERILAIHGITAHLRSAYKPLVHAVLEEIDLSDATAVEIAYPRHELCTENRFRLETYPVAALCNGAEISFVPGNETAFTYQLTITRGNGNQTSHYIFAPNRIHQDCIGETLVSPTGWLRVRDAQGEILTDGRLETDYEAAFHTTIDAIAHHDWGGSEPYFNELNIRVTLPIADQPLGIGDEVLSLREALHEDFYFSLLEFFQKKSGRPLGDRGLQPGQIVPEIIQMDGAPSVRVTLRDFDLAVIETPDQSLDQAQAALNPDQIIRELVNIEGEVFDARSRAGRQIFARYHAGTDKPVMISGGQHPNETSGVVGALRAAQTLNSRENSHFTISPLENPDGYALHQRLIQDNPRHMHHAARYTALGDDLEYRKGTNLLEKEIRVRAQEISGADLHINLHGYPAHEWTRPLSGYVPRGFAMWTLPKGFFLILRHHESAAERAEMLIDRVTKRLADMPGLLEFNASQIKLYETHAGEHGFRMINGFPCWVSIDDRHDVPITLITEYPDETVYGDAFIAGHTAQMATVLAAYDAHQEMS